MTVLHKKEHWRFVWILKNGFRLTKISFYFLISGRGQTAIHFFAIWSWLFLISTSCGQTTTLERQDQPVEIIRSHALESNIEASATAAVDVLKFFVSPDGNDNWSGLLPAPNLTRTDGPLSTVVAARDKLRESRRGNSGLNVDIFVILRGGTYYLSNILRFTPDDSGTKMHPVNYMAYPGEYPVISGGRPVVGWQPVITDMPNGKPPIKLWRTKIEYAVPGGINQLFVNGNRRQRCRGPNIGSFYRASGTGSKNATKELHFEFGDVGKWENTSDAIFVVYHSWETSIHHIQSVDYKKRVVTFVEEAPWPFGKWERRQRYYVENIFEELDSPGEWFFNSKSGDLYYYPLPDERIETAKIVVPFVNSTLVSFDSDSSGQKFVEYLQFDGISFQHTNAALLNIRNPMQAEINQSAAISAQGLRHSAFKNCEVTHVGAHAMWMGSGCDDIQIEQCHLHDLAGGGVYIGGGWGVQTAAPTGNITVNNNYIHDGGYLFHGAHGVWIGRSSHNRVTHNEISNFDYSGISCGWSWGFQKSSAHDNQIEFNHIHHLSNREGLSDMGGIYFLGVSPGTTARNNYLHDIYSYPWVSTAAGIYTDQGSSEIVLENNIISSVSTASVFQHYGANNYIRNNIFVANGNSQLIRGREDLPCHFVVERNIFFSNSPQVLAGKWSDGNWVMGSNLYWSSLGEPVFAGLPLEQWAEKTGETKSLVADPLFIDAAKSNYDLKKDSPAFKIDFRPIDATQAGLYGDFSWTNLPSHYRDRPLANLADPDTMAVDLNYDFEKNETGDLPPDATIIAEGVGDAITVTAEESASGRQSLKFVDSSSFVKSWMPHLNYRKRIDSGSILFSWDMLNSAEFPARFSVELRSYAVDGTYIVGPIVRVDTLGNLFSNEVQLGTVALGTWMHVEIRFVLENRPCTSYQLRVSVSGKEKFKKEIPLPDEMLNVTWLGVSSLNSNRAIFFLDNLKLTHEN